MKRLDNPREQREEIHEWMSRPRQQERRLETPPVQPPTLEDMWHKLKTRLENESAARSAK
jgi:hypothetical protein